MSWNIGSIILSPKGVAYQLTKVLGEGSEAAVFHANILDDKGEAGEVALKVKSLCNALTPQDLGTEKTEGEILASIKPHPNLLTPLEHFEPPGEGMEVMSFPVALWNLREYLNRRAGLPVAPADKEAQAFGMFYQLVSGLSHLHKEGYAHRDVKCENILIMADGREEKRKFPRIALTDFGFCMDLRSGRPARDEVGSPHYMAPEVSTKEGYDAEKADVWSVGVVLHALLFNRLPFMDGLNDAEIIQAAINGDIRLDSEPSSSLHRMLERMITEEDKRCRMKDIFKEEFWEEGCKWLELDPKGKSISTSPFNSHGFIRHKDGTHTHPSTRRPKNLEQALHSTTSLGGVANVTSIGNMILPNAVGGLDGGVVGNILPLDSVPTLGTGIANIQPIATQQNLVSPRSVQIVTEAYNAPVQVATTARQVADRGYYTSAPAATTQYVSGGGGAQYVRGGGVANYTTYAPTAVAQGVVRGAGTTQRLVTRQQLAAGGVGGYY